MNLLTVISRCQAKLLLPRISIYLIKLRDFQENSSKIAYVQFRIARDSWLDSGYPRGETPASIMQVIELNLVSSCVSKRWHASYSQTQTTMSFTKLLSSGWSFTQIGGGQVTESGGWLPVSQFPTTVHVELLKLNKIPDPFIGMNEWDVQCGQSISRSCCISSLTSDS